MDFNEFRKQIMKDLPEVLPRELNDAVIEENNVAKLQKASYEGISIRKEKQSVGMSVDLSTIYQGYAEGKSYQTVLQQVAAKVKDGLEHMPQIGMEQLGDYDMLKQKLSIEMVPTKGNEEMLKRMPHKEIEDMSVVYRFALRRDEEGRATTLVTNQLLDSFHVTPEQLHKDAMIYAPLNYPAEIKNMTDILKEMMGEEFYEIAPVPEDQGMYVATVTDRIQGAAVLAYPGFCEQAAEKLGGDYYVLPSSIHEIILLKDDGKINRNVLETMVHEVNATQVMPEEQLSEHVYHYDSRERLFEMAEKYESRKAKEQPEKESVLKELETRQKKKEKKQVRTNHLKSEAVIL